MGSSDSLPLRPKPPSTAARWGGAHWLGFPGQQPSTEFPVRQPGVVCHSPPETSSDDCW